GPVGDAVGAPEVAEGVLEVLPFAGHGGKSLPDPPAPVHLDRSPAPVASRSGHGSTCRLGQIAPGCPLAPFPGPLTHPGGKGAYVRAQRRTRFAEGFVRLSTSVE